MFLAIVAHYFLSHLLIAQLRAMRVMHLQSVLAVPSFVNVWEMRRGRR
jgi:hypothetical protein